MSYLQTEEGTCLVPGVLEHFGEEARLLRKIIRSMEDVLDQRGFDQLDFGLLTKDQLYVRNLEFLGERFMDNLSYVELNGEERDITILPEGTMRVYDYISRNNIDRAKIFYSSQFVRNEDPSEVSKGKTRNFWQIGFEIFNYSELESSLEAIRTANELIRSSGLDTATIRIADKRLLKGLIGKFSPEEQKIIKKIIDKSDDSPEKFVKLYSDNGGTDPSVSSEVGDFLSLIHEDELTIGSLRKHASGSETYQQGVENLGRLYEQLQREMQIKILPFMSKSWDACDKMMFDVRDKSFDGALCGGGNLTYQNYRPDAFKSGAGIGVTRVNEILKRKG